MCKKQLVLDFKKIYGYSPGDQGARSYESYSNLNWNPRGNVAIQNVTLELQWNEKVAW